MLTKYPFVDLNKLTDFTFKYVWEVCGLVRGSTGCLTFICRDEFTSQQLLTELVQAESTMELVNPSTYYKFILYSLKVCTVICQHCLVCTFCSGSSTEIHFYFVEFCIMENGFLR